MRGKIILRPAWESSGRRDASVELSGDYYLLRAFDSGEVSSRVGFFNSERLAVLLVTDRACFSASIRYLEFGTADRYDPEQILTSKFLL